MVRMHSVDVEASAATLGSSLHFDTQPCLFPTLYKWLGHIPDAYNDTRQQARLSLQCKQSAVLMCQCMHTVQQLHMINSQQY